ncbi:hypothetical protein [Mycobacteroides abscessus]|uniref:hypothetical protein n=1 Tax=Mycobacteroides abscessus TaxID=36809 RepID=UPI0009A831FF|nr:hypothetical protein [Mycobacteroides abscessus]SKP49486.1 Uncharacterised protein [Mycobacteroides abscessus subsp. massiliense]
MTRRNDFAAFIQDRFGGYRIDLLTNDDASNKVPTWWLEINTATGKDAINAALNHWRPLVGNLLPHTLTYIERNGIDVFIAQAIPVGDQPEKFFLIYALEDPDDSSSFQARFGPLPAAEGALPRYWTNLPPQLQRFYLTVHDGFSDAPTGAGLHPAEGFVALSEFGDQDDYEFSTPEHAPNIEDLIEIGGDGYGGALYVDISNNQQHAWDWYEGNLQSKELWQALDTLLVAE